MDARVGGPSHSPLDYASGNGTSLESNMGNRVSGAALLVCAALASAGATPSAEVLQHHADAVRSGRYAVPRLDYAHAAGLHRDRRFDGRVPGAINAQPLYWRQPGRPALVLVATERNVVAALDARTGKPVWERRLGPPVPGVALPCGNIAPLGITGTPVIDPGHRAIYLDAMVLAHRQPRHLVFGLSLEDGATLPGWPVDIQSALHSAAGHFRARDQNQRGALAILHHVLYIPYGGHYGDCGSYHGWVVGIPLDRPDRIRSFATRARGGGIWAPGGIVAADGALFVATGNTFGARDWQEGEAILRLPPDLRFTGGRDDFFTPRDWRRLDAVDADLGGSNPVPLEVPGGIPRRLLLALGKDGKAYLLDRADLGGIGGALRIVQVADGPIRTAPASYTEDGSTFVVFQGRSRRCPDDGDGAVVALRVDPGSPPTVWVAWCADAHGRGSPMVTTAAGQRDPIVWVAGAEGDSRLRGFRGDTGEVVFDGRGTRMRAVAHFQTPIVADGRIYVAASQRVYAFAF